MAGLRPAEPSVIVVRIQLHTPRLAPAALGSVFEYGKKVSGNSRNNKIFEYGKKMSGNSRTNKIFEYGKKVSGNRKTTKSFGYRGKTTKLFVGQKKCDKQGAPNDTGVTDCGKCLETGKRQNPLNTESVWKQENDKILCMSKNVTDAEHRTTF